MTRRTEGLLAEFKLSIFNKLRITLAYKSNFQVSTHTVTRAVVSFLLDLPAKFDHSKVSIYDLTGERRVQLKLDSLFQSLFAKRP